MEGNGRDPQLKPMTAASSAPSQQTVTREYGGDPSVIEKVAQADPHEFETPSASHLTNLKKAKESSIWGRKWTLPPGMTLEHPPGDYRLEAACMRDEGLMFLRFPLIWCTGFQGSAPSADGCGCTGVQGHPKERRLDGAC